jgi:hypothetical protein
MIKSLSPYYVTIPWASPLTSAVCTSYKLQIFIWDGLKASVPIEPYYEISKDNLTTSSGNDKINIARLINDFVDFRPASMTLTGLYDGDNQRWIKTQVIYTTENVLDLDVVQLEAVSLMVKGYAYGMDGENTSTPTNRILLSGIEFKVNRSGFFNLPILADEVATYPVTVKSYPDNVLNFSDTILASTTSSELVQNIFINVAQATTDTVIEITFNSIVTSLLITDECRYTPIEIAFQNKEGALQFITFFKAKTESLSTESEEYQSDNGQPSLGFHQYTKYNVQGRSKFKVNSGFVKEELNETFRQLFLSERVWQLENSIYIPLNVASKSLEYKSRQKDRLINYEVEFEYAFNEINNI